MDSNQQHDERVEEQLGESKSHDGRTDIEFESDLQADSVADSDLYVVGVGASAGGLEALERFFRSMSPNSGFAFVVIQHLSPDFKSLMDELLARHTSMAIHRVADGMRVEADSIYLIPPRKEMIISGGKLLLTDKDPDQDLSLPIDHFFRSLAQDAGPRAVAVVLSGTGSDGSRGLRDVHDAGGLVIVQDDETAKFDGMPRSARDTGLVDLVLPPEEMPQALAEHRNRRRDGIDGAAAGAELEGKEAIFKLLRDDYGIDFSYYKPNTVGRRIERRLSLGGIGDLETYVERLREDSQELNSLYRDLLIGVTRFFRDREAFERLEHEILPELLARKSPSEELRIWIAGCATGEEAYSIAILIDERLRLAGRSTSVKIFATDVHRASLEIAGAGVYKEEALADVTPARLSRYFVRKPDGYHVTNELRQMVVFALHNIIKDAPFTKLDLITCRNLLIYLQPGVQKKVMSLFHFGLRTGGVLFLGPSESPGELSGEFEDIDQHWKFFRKRRDVRLPADMRLPLSAMPVRVKSTMPSASSESLPVVVYDKLLEKYVPAGLLLDERRRLLHTFGSATRFLVARPGRTSNDVIDVLHDDLRLPIAGAVQRAIKEKSTVVYQGIRITFPAGEERLKLTVEPILNRQSNITNLFVALESAEFPAGQAPAPAEIAADEASRDLVQSLESELHYTRENLQAAIEELETSNEEMQATNEELVAGNEELQSTNEELHSVNEELYTVNAEYQKKIVELTELTDDMDNLLRSTDIGVVFLDRGLCIRKFTPQIARAFDLLPHDVGRRIDNFTHTIRYPELLDDLNQVLATGKPVEREVEDRRGGWMLARILPYRSHSELQGVVLSLIDVSMLKRSVEDNLRYARELEAAVDELRQAVERRKVAEEEARDGIERRDRFLAILSHELRNPLAAIVNAVRLAEFDSLDEESRRNTFGVVRRQSQQMTRLLDDLLDVSRITRNKIEIRKQVVDLRNTARDAAEAVRPLLDSHRLPLELELPEEPVYVEGDPARLQQIQVNLLTNAVKYTDHGSVRLAVRQERNDSDEQEAVISVRDTGRGIPPHMVEHIFDLFVQLDGTVGASDGGMGVGLTLVRSLVKLHGGKVSARSDGPGQGSEFLVRLPMLAGSEPARAPAAPLSVLSGLKVLLVEDQEDIRVTTRWLLAALGCRVTDVGDGPKALETFDADVPDLALVDIGLPDMDGYEVARNLRCRNSSQRTTLIALTGFGRAGDREAALAAGFDAHLVKPMDPMVLANVVRESPRRK
jgi:two-component system CheB/CheR fusion protein